MPTQALALPDDSEPEPQPVERVRIPKRVRHACELLANGNVKTISAAAERAGMSREWLSKMLSRSHVQAFLTREASRTIATAKWRASNKLVELIDAQSEHVAAKVADRILTSEGILKSEAGQVSVNVDIKAGYVLDLREAGLTSNQPRNEAKPLIQHAPVRGVDVEEE